MSRPIDFPGELNSEQYAAVSGGDGYCLVIAGPGSGKTRVLVYRLAWLVRNAVPPDRILLLTFTNKAAAEMLERARRLLGSFPNGLTGGTFHHAGNLCLRRHAASLGYRNDFIILDRSDSRDLISRVSRETVGRVDRFFPKPEVLAGIVGFAANSCLDLETVIGERFSQFERYLPQIERLALAYHESKKKAGAMDFDDLLVNWLLLLRQDEKVRAHYQDRFRYILVDEFQDTNRLQFETLKLLSARHRNLMVVGDDAQSIYSFRAADVRNALEFPGTFPGAKVLRLETNYRSTPEILTLANSIISHNRNQFPKALRRVLPSGARPIVCTAGNESLEARHVADEIGRLLSTGFARRDIAVLFRSRYQSARLEKELAARHQPYVIRGGLRFYEQAHAKDVIAFLKVLVHRYDEISWRRLVLMRGGFGDAYFRRLWAVVGQSPNPFGALSGPEAAAAVPRSLSGELAELGRLMSGLSSAGHLAAPGKVIRFLLDEYYRDFCDANYQDARERVSDISEMASMADGAGSLSDYIDQVVMGDDFSSAGPGEDSGSLTLSTIHQAKGLEWRVVFVVGLNEGSFPSGRCLDDPSQLEEERRLFFVAVTRAREHVRLSYPVMRRGWSGESAFCPPSRFLEEIPQSGYEECEAGDEWSADRDFSPRGRRRGRF